MKSVLLGLGVLLTVFAASLIALSSLIIALPAVALILFFSIKHIRTLWQIQSIVITQTNCTLTTNRAASHNFQILPETKLYPNFIDLKLKSLETSHVYWCPVFEDAISAGAFADLKLFLEGKLT